MAKSSPWMDRLSLLLSMLVVIGSGWWLWHSGTFNMSLTKDSNLTWHFIRSAGTAAYILLTASTVWGLFISAKVVKNWSPGVMSMLMHATLSWLAILFGMGHGLLLLVDRYFNYRLTDVLVPFTGPYRPFATGLGIIGFWIALIVTLSFSVRRQMGNRAWRTLHLSSYIAFGLSTVHGLLAGADAQGLGFRLMMALCVMLVLGLLSYRMWGQETAGNRKTPSAAHSS